MVTAQRLASRANLQVEVIEVNHPTVPAGTVILQAPEMDTTLKKGDTVVITAGVPLGKSGSTNLIKAQVISGEDL